MKVHSRRTLPWMFLLCLIDPGSFQDLVSEGFIGQSVLLPCRSSESSSVNVFWRDKNDKVLLDIKEGRPDVDSQDQKYKGRVSSFPEEYQKKNFSIIMEKLEQGDAGNYSCTILIDGKAKTTKIKLSVKEDVKNSAACGSTRTNVLQMFVLSALSLLSFF